MPKRARKTTNSKRKERKKKLHKEAATRVLLSKQAGEFVYKELVWMMKRKSTPTSPACNREQGRKGQAKEVNQSLKEQIRVIHAEMCSLEVKLAE